MKKTELERTFLLKRLPEGLDGCRKMEVEDVYIPASVEHPILRIRRIGNKFEITKKSPAKESDASEQHEHTIELSKGEWEALSKTDGRRTVKTRYFLEHDRKKMEIDVFRGPLEGLALADFEFSTKDERDAFRPPDFCLADVTQEEFIAGGMLCGKGYGDIEPELKRFGYRKVTPL